VQRAVGWPPGGLRIIGSESPALYAVYWLIALPSIFLLLLLGGLLPYGALARAARTVRDRSPDARPRVAWREITHFGRFLVRAAVVPLAILGAVQLALILHHELLGPGNLLASVFGDAHPEIALNAPDLEHWAQLYEEARAVVPLYKPKPLTAMKAALWTNWPMYPAYLALAFVFIVGFFATRYVRLVRKYRAGILRRSRPRNGRADAPFAPAGHRGAGLGI
jgi:hypothetical protein